MSWNLPNFLTILRIFLIPVLIAVFYTLPAPWNSALSCAIFSLAAFTDWLDGWLARRSGQTTRFGAFLDPVADKLIVVSVLIILVEQYPSIWLALAAWVIIGREIIISALREWMAQIGQREMVGVSWIGKLKTATQMAALLLLLWHQPLWGVPVTLIGETLLLIAAGLTLWSMIVYLRAALPCLLTHDSP